MKVENPASSQTDEAQQIIDEKIADAVDPANLAYLESLSLEERKRLAGADDHEEFYGTSPEDIGL